MRTPSTPGRKGKRPAFADINLAALAPRVGISVGHLYRIVKGENCPSLPVALRLAEILGVDIGTIVALYKPPESQQTETGAETKKTRDRDRKNTSKRAAGKARKSGTKTR